MHDKFIFSVTTMKNLNGRSLVSNVPDKYGYYTQAGGVINHHTENSTFYEPEIFRKQMVDPNNIFNKNLVRGCLYGESDHPDVAGTVEDVPRLLQVKNDRVSHHIRHVETIPLKEVPGAFIILLKVKPHGVYGPLLKESLDSEFVNTMFSLRSIIRERWDAVKQLKIRSMLQLVTFDWVTVGGSPEASKRFSASNIGVECYSRTLSTELLAKSFYDYGKVAGLESVSDAEIKHMLKDIEINLNVLNYDLSGLKESGSPNLIDARTGDRRSITHIGFKHNGGIC